MYLSDGLKPTQVLAVTAIPVVNAIQVRLKGFRWVC